VACSAQTTITLTNTVLQAGVAHAGIDPSQLVEYANGQMYKSLYYADGGDLPSYYNQTSWSCNVGGTGGTPTTTSWPNNAANTNAFVTSYSASGTAVTLNGTGFGFFVGQQVYFNGFLSATFLNGHSAFLSSASSTQLVFAWNSSIIGTTADAGGVYFGFVPNFFVGATFVAKNSATGATYGTGTITASTATTTAHGPVFTLSPAISSACSNGDILIVKLNSVNTLMTPEDLFGRTGASLSCSGAVFNTSDISPSSSNPYNSLELPTGCSITLYADQVTPNLTNGNPALTSLQVNGIDINGSYTQSLKYKCGASSGTGSLTYGLFRQGGSTFISNTTVTPACSSVSGAAWNTATNAFTGTETQTDGHAGNLTYVITCNSGPCLLNDMDVVEGSTLAGGNPTPYRDDFIRRLQAIQPGVIRWMDSSLWCSTVADETGSLGARRWCNVGNFLPFSLSPTMGYTEMLQVCAFIGSDCSISIGMFNQPADWSSLITWLSTNTSYLALVAAGHKVHLEAGNEAFNSGAGGAMYQGDGILYGSWIGPNMAAAKAATGYNATSMKRVGNSWFAPGQCYGTFSWIYEMLTTAGATTNGLPDLVDIAPYNFSYLGGYTTSGSDVSATAGAPWLDMFAEISNYDSIIPSGNNVSTLEATAYVKSTFGLGTMVYEEGIGTISGIAVTQRQLNEVTAGVGQALTLNLHNMLMRRDANLTGPLGIFALTEEYNGFTCNSGSCVSGVVFPAWGIERMLPCGPGELTTCSDASRPASILLQMINNAIGSNSNFMVTTQSNTPTYNYAADQNNSGTPTILANSAVPYVDCGAYSNGSTAWTVLCWNKSLSSSETVTLTGAGAPTGSVTEWVYPKSGESLISNNENSYLGTGSLPPQDVLPSSVSTSGTSFVILPASMIALAYTTGSGPPPPTAPVSLTGNVVTTGNVVSQ
jgi:hypothetical protein